MWGSEEEIERQIELRHEKQKTSKLKSYKKKLKGETIDRVLKYNLINDRITVLELRMATRSSLYTKVTKASHEHIYDTEIYNEEEDNYERTCTSCGFHEIFEKM